MRKVISELCGVNERSYYIWKNKTHPKLINLLELYFSEEDITEFLNSGQISKMETLNHYELSLNIELNIFYRKMERKQYLLRFFWDFLSRYKDKISDIEFYDCKKTISQLMLDYHLTLIELCNNTYDNGVHALTIRKYSEFMAIFQELSQDLVYFIIQNMKSNFKSHINYLVNNVLYSYAIEILSCATINYYDDKSPENRELRGNLFIKAFPSEFDKYGKDFYVQLEKYLKNYPENELEIINLIQSENDRLLLN